LHQALTPELLARIVVETTKGRRVILPLLTLAISAGSPIPTPGFVLMQNASPRVLTHRLLAQADTESEDRRAVEAELEADMQRARSQLRGSEGEPPPQPEYEPAPVPEPPPHPAPRMDRGIATPRRPAVLPSEVPPDVFDPRSRNQKPTIDGEGKVSYLVWGIVDWSIAGAMWVAAGICALAASFLLTTPSSSLNPGFNETAGYLYIAVSAGLGTGGGLMAWRAANNIGNFKLLKDREEALGF